MKPRALDSIDDGLATLPSGALCVGFSGGLDSTVLLHRLSTSPAARARGLRALHVDHAMHRDSATWAEHCIDVAAKLQIPIEIVRVDVSVHRGTGPEDAARRARFGAFEIHAGDGEFLVLAHHADDQAETILLKLLRGAGPEGMGGMRVLRPFGRGSLWRPLLDVPKSALVDYAREHRLAWIDDPSNADTRLRRNFLRREIMPRLRERWPDTTIALSHSAHWMRAAAEHIDGQAGIELQRIRHDVNTVHCGAWLALSDAVRDAVLRRWLRELDLPQPAFFHVAEIERQIRHAAADRSPCVSWPGCEIRRYRDLIYAMKPVAADTDWQLAWNGSKIELPDGSSLHTAAPLADELIVRNRRGGERIKPADGAHHRDGRLLLQEAGVPPWARTHLPLIYQGDDLVAVADIAFSDRGRELLAAPQTQMVWTSTSPRAPLIPARR